MGDSVGRTGSRRQRVHHPGDDSWLRVQGGRGQRPYLQGGDPHRFLSVEQCTNKEGEERKPVNIASVMEAEMTSIPFLWTKFDPRFSRAR